MAYSRPAFNSANVTWQGQSAYTRQAFNAANVTWLDSASSALLSAGGLPLAPSVLATTKLVASLLDAGVLGTPTVWAFHGNAAWAAVTSPLGTATVLATHGRVVFVSAASPLGAINARAFTDFTGAIPAIAAITYVMDLITPGGKVRVPISSWQATLQVGRPNFLSCVVPACAAWLADVNVATEFVISRCVIIAGVRIESEMARCPVQTTQTDRGPTNYTLSMSGYGDAIVADANPNAIYDRELTDVRSISAYDSGTRIRCGIDWLLRPPMRAFYGETSLLVSYINYYAQGNDRYMDVGERIE